MHRFVSSPSGAAPSFRVRRVVAAGIGGGLAGLVFSALVDQFMLHAVSPPAATDTTWSEQPSEPAPQQGAKHASTERSHEPR